MDKSDLKKIDKHTNLIKQYIEEELIFRKNKKIRDNIINDYDLKILEELKCIFLIRNQYDKLGLIGKEKVILNEIFHKYTMTEKRGADSYNNHRSKMMYIITMVDFFKRRLYNEDILGYKTFEPQIGEIYFANLLLGFNKELSFEHPVLILEVDQKNKKLFCVPLTSPKYFKDEFNKKKPLVNEKTQLLIKKIYSDMKKDSLILLNEPQTISFYRLSDTERSGFILDKNKKNFNIRKEMFSNIKSKIFEFTNPKENIKLIKLSEDVELLKKEIENMKKNEGKN
jgi:hypothetical protein